MLRRKSSTSFWRLAHGRLNTRLLFSLIAPAILLGVGLYVVHAVQVKRTAASFWAQASRAAQEGDDRKAELYLKRFLVHEPRNAAALGRLGLIQSNFARTQDDWAGVGQVLEQALRYDPHNRGTRRRLAEAEIRLGRFDKAQVHLKVLLGEPALSAALLPKIPAIEAAELADLLGECAIKSRDFAQAAHWFRTAISDAPGRVDTYGRLADMLRNPLENRLGADHGIAELARILDDAPAAALDAARRMILGNLRRPVAQRDWLEVEQVLDRSARAMPGSAEVVILRAEALFARGQFDRARELLERARDDRPMQVELWIALSQLADRRQTSHRALSILKEAEKQLGDRALLRVAYANHWARRGGDGARKELAELARNLVRFSPDDQERILRALADAHLAVGDRPTASRLVQELAIRRPRDLGLRFAQFNLALGSGDEKAMEESLEGVQIAENELLPPDTKPGPVWHFARSRYLIWSAKRRGNGAISTDQLDQARLSLAEASKRQPSWPVLAVAEAEIDELSGRLDAAIKAYQRAIDLGMHNLDVIRQAVQLLYERRRYDQADELIRRLQTAEVFTANAEFHRPAAEVLTPANDRDRTLEDARKTIPADSRNYRDHLWLAQILWAAGEPGQAEPELRRAVALGGAAPEAWITLVQFLARTGRTQEARAVIQEARSHLTGENAALAVARCFAEVGDLGQARALLRPALAAQPNDVPTWRADASFALASGAMRDAEADLRAIVGLKRESPDDADWARRLLALVLTASGNRQKSLEALQLVGLSDEGAAYAPGDNEPIDEIRARAKVLSLRNNRDARRAAIRALQHVIGREPNNSDDQILLVDLYEADGNWLKAGDQLKGLLASNNHNPLYLAHNTLILLRQGSTDAAQLSLTALELLEPASLRTLELAAKLLAARGRSGDSVQSLVAWADKQVDQTGYIAKLLEELGQYAPALQLFERAARRRPDSPEATLALAGFLGRRNRVADALDLCEKLRASCRPDDIAAAMVAVLYSASIDEVQCRRAAQLIETDLRKSPGAAGLLFHLANIRSLQARYQDAEALYRQSVARDQTNSGPVANLAWLLVRRQGKGTEALELIREAILKDGPTPDLLDTRALAYMLTGQSDLAIKDLEDAIAVRPSALKYVHLAQAYLMANRRNDASSALKDAKAAGLIEDSLSPLERESCQRLVQELAQR